MSNNMSNNSNNMNMSVSINKASVGTAHSASTYKLLLMHQVWYDWNQHLHFKKALKCQSLPLLLVPAPEDARPPPFGIFSLEISKIYFHFHIVKVANCHWTIFTSNLFVWFCILEVLQHGWWHHCRKETVLGSLWGVYLSLQRKTFFSGSLLGRGDGGSATDSNGLKQTSGWLE